MTSLKNATVYIFVLAAISLIGVIVLLCLNKPIPTELWAALTLLLGGGLGIASPSPSPGTVTTTTPTPVALTTTSATPIVTTTPPGSVPTGSAG